MGPVIDQLTALLEGDMTEDTSNMSSSEVDDMIKSLDTISTELNTPEPTSTPTPTPAAEPENPPQAQEAEKVDTLVAEGSEAVVKPSGGINLIIEPGSGFKVTDVQKDVPINDILEAKPEDPKPDTHL